MESKMEEALALLDEAPDALTALQVPDFLSSFGPELLWGISDEDIGDLSSVETDSALPITVHPFTDETMNPSNSDSSLSRLGDEELLSGMNNEIVDFGTELVSTPPFNALEVVNTSTTVAKPLVKKKKRKQINKKKKNPNKARNERRFQLIELQGRVAELEFTLTGLQAIQNKRLKNIQHPSCFDEKNDGMPRVWQDICSRQISRRIKAEWENKKLKKQYEKEKQLVKSLKKLIDKRQGPFMDAEPQTTKQTRRIDIPAGYIERMTSLVFKELSAGVKTCYSKLEIAFEADRPVPMNLVTHSPMLDKGISMKGVEQRFYDKRTMPFDMRTTGAAWWENWHNYRGQRFQDIAANEITESFGLEMSDLKTSMSATAYSQQITHRHVEDDRIVYVWDAYTEPFGFGNDRISGVYFLEQNFVLNQPEDWSSERVDVEGNGFCTRVSTCYVITPHFLDPKLKEDATIRALINFLVSVLSTKLMALTETVETLLLDRALQQCNDK